MSIDRAKTAKKLPNAQKMMLNNHCGSTKERGTNLIYRIETGEVPFISKLKFKNNPCGF